MAKPLIAIVGRPNVGKSALFNRIAANASPLLRIPRRNADRLYASGDWCGREFSIVDTGE